MSLSVTSPGGWDTVGERSEPRAGTDIQGVLRGCQAKVECTACTECLGSSQPPGAGYQHCPHVMGEAVEAQRLSCVLRLSAPRQDQDSAPGGQAPELRAENTTRMYWWPQQL